jgi:hypothetical protein
LTEVDAQLADLEAEQAWPELAERIEKTFANTVSWLAQLGTTAEKATLDHACVAARRALQAQDATEVERQLGVMRRLFDGAYFRAPDVWEWEFQRLAAQASEATDLRRATELVQQGHDARRQHDMATLERVVRELWALQPVDRETQQRGHGSGVWMR